MPTSSITKTFVLSGDEQVERFIAAFEESKQDRPERVPVRAKFLKGEELRQFIEERNAGKRCAI